jgi:hypothetical protein
MGLIVARSALKIGETYTLGPLKWRSAPRERAAPDASGQPQTAAAQATKPPRPNRTDCIHHHGSLGEFTAHLCGGCQGNQQTTVCECELHGKCAPLAWAPVPDESVRRCVDCASYRRREK